MRTIACAVVLLVALTACGKDFVDPTPGRSNEPPSAELLARNVVLLPGDASAVRISFRPKDPSVRLRIERSTDAGRVIACPLRGIDDPIPPVAQCLPDVPAGVRENLTTPGLGAVAIIRDGAPMTIELRLSFEEGGRAFAIRMPVVRTQPSKASCVDNACSPVFELNPLHTGRLKATASWTSGTARFALLEGRVQARALSSTGIPYGVAQARTGAGPLAIDIDVTAPSEYALVLDDTGGSDLEHVQVTIGWP